MALIDLIAPGLGPLTSLGPFAINPTGAGLTIASTSPRSGSSSKYLNIDVNSATGSFAKQYSVDKTRVQVMFAIEATNWLTNGTIFSFSHAIYQTKDIGAVRECTIGIEWDAAGVPRFYAELNDTVSVTSQRLYWSVTIIEGTWYVIEADFNVAASPWTLDWKIKPDGGSYTAGAQVSLVSAANSLRYYYVGVNGISSMQAKIQDIHVADGTAYYGDHKTETVQVDAVGTHSLDASPSSFFDKLVSGTPTALTSSETTSYTTIQDNPLDADGNYIRIKPSTGGPPVTPAFRAAGTAVYTANNVANPTSLNPVKPAGGSDGECLVLITESRSITATVSTPTGWTLITGPRRSATASGGTIYVFAKIADSSANDAPTVTWTGLATTTTGDSAGARIHAYTGLTVTLDGTPPAVNDAASTTSITIPANTTALDKSMVIGVAIRINDTAHTFTVATFTERSDDHTTTGTGHGTVVASLVKTPAGSSGTATVTPSNTTSSRTLAISFALAAALSTSQPVNTQYAEYTLANPAANTVDAVWVAAALGNDTANATSSADLRLRDTAGSTEANVHSGAINTATKIYKNATFPTKPGTATAWDTTAINALRLRFGYTADATGNLDLHAVEMVVSFPAVSNTAIGGSDASGGTSETQALVARPTGTDASGGTSEAQSLSVLATDSSTTGGVTEAAALTALIPATDASGGVSETQQVAQSKSGTDASGGVTEAQALVARPTDADASGGVAEAAVQTSALSSSDASGGVSEAQQVAQTKVGTDASGGVTEAQTQVAAIPATDVNAGVVEVAALRLSAADVNGGVSEAVVQQAAIPASDASGGTVETAFVRITTQDASGIIAEAQAVLVAAASADASGGTTEFASTDNTQQINSSDVSGGTTEVGTPSRSTAAADASGGTVESASVGSIPIAASDASGGVSEAQLLVARPTATDVGGASEAQTVAITPVSTDASGGTSEVAALVARPTSADLGGSSSDAELLVARMTTGDNAGAIDAQSLQALLLSGDLGAATEAQLVGKVFLVTDAGSSSEAESVRAVLNDQDAGTADENTLLARDTVNSLPEIETGTVRRSKGGSIERGEAGNVR